MSQQSFVLPVLVVAACLLLSACGSEPPPPAASDVPAAIPEGEPGYEIAGTVELEERTPQEWPDLHNVYHLSDTIISGSEPHGEEALKRIADR